jgi:hypothetical protein
VRRPSQSVAFAVVFKQPLQCFINGPTRYLSPQSPSQSRHNIVAPHKAECISHSFSITSGLVSQQSGKGKLIANNVEFRYVIKRSFGRFAVQTFGRVVSVDVILIPSLCFSLHPHCSNMRQFMLIHSSRLFILLLHVNSGRRRERERLFWQKEAASLYTLASVH